MPVPGYGVLIGGISDRRLATPKKNHYEVRVEAAGASYRLAVNVQSADGSEVLYHIDEAFMNPLTTPLAALGDGHHALPSKAGGVPWGLPLVFQFEGRTPGCPRVAALALDPGRAPTSYLVTNGTSRQQKLARAKR